jgi:hypothetical protein
MVFKIMNMQEIRGGRMLKTTNENAMQEDNTIHYGLQ